MVRVCCHLALNLGQLDVAVQVFRGHPRAGTGGSRQMVSKPVWPYLNALLKPLQRTIQATGADYVAERRWEPYQAPAGDPENVAPPPAGSG